MRRIRTVLICVAALAASPLPAQVSDEPLAPPPEARLTPAEAAERFRQRSGRLLGAKEVTPPTAAELLAEADKALRSAAAVKLALGAVQPKAAAVSDAGLRLVPKDLHLGKIHLEQKPVCYLAMRVWLVNTTDRPVTVARESFRLAIRGDELTPGVASERQGRTRLAAGGRVVELAELSKTGPVTIPGGEAVDLLVAFFDIPNTSEVPEMTLRLPVADKTIALSLNDYALGLMGLTVERLGARGLLGLVTVEGEITPVGAGGLIDVLRQLADDDATRVVIVWSKEAPPVPPDLSNWLVQSATRIGGTPANDGQHPVLPGTLVELHLAAIPDGTGVPNYPGPRRIHADVGEAVTAALGRAYDNLPLEELITEIESGHHLTRPAAVAAGGRLPDERLLLTLTGDEDPEIATAAVAALREFGTDAAVDRLVELAKAGQEPVRSAAVESLAASRFGVAHEALRTLLDASVDGPAAVPPEALVPVLARYPRPLWGDALYRMATRGEPGVRAESLEALAKLGHPELVEAFEAALGDENERLRNRAFTLVAGRGDAESETLALAFTLKHLESSPPTREMYALLGRTKDSRAVPLLLKHLDEQGDHSDLIRLLSQVGGLEVRDALEVAYPALDKTVQPLALATLAQMESPKFYEYAAAALRSNDPGLVNAAQHQLQADGGPQAVQLLVTALAESEQPAMLSYAANGLAGIGTPEARAALRKAARSNDERGRAAAQAWWNLQQQSAGWDAFRAGRLASDREDWKQAAERYSDAVELDPQFIDAWSGRANAHMQLEDYAAARADYEQALELDPADSAAVTCLGILRVLDGRVEEGLTFVRERTAEFEDSAVFAYNTACLYAVASERVAKDDATRAERLRTDAVMELARSIELGMTEAEDVAWMRKDPDLTSLRERHDFQEVVTEAEAKAREKEAAPRE